MLLDELMPTYHFNEVHSISIEASPDRIFLAIKEVTPKEIPLFRWLLWVRWLPILLTRKLRFAFAGTEPLLEQALRQGFVLVAEESGRELVVGTIGQFWKLSGSLLSPAIKSGADFVRFNRPGYARVLLNFHVSFAGRDRINLRTETRILATEEISRKKFSAYWTLIHPGSALVRRAWLAAIRRRSER